MHPDMDGNYSVLLFPTNREEEIKEPSGLLLVEVERKNGGNALF